MFDREALRRLIESLALERGEFRLASGKIASYYLDCRKVTLDSQGAFWIGHGVLGLIRDKMPDALGGMAIGADPITGAVLTVAASEGQTLRGFIVRKEAKQHGTGRSVEGAFRPGDSAVIVEDVATTGGSSLKAIDHAEAAGMQVREVIAIVDRMGGAREAFAERGVGFRSLFTVADFGLDP